MVMARRRGSGIDRGRGDRLVKSRNHTPGLPSGAFIAGARSHPRRHHTQYKPRTEVRGWGDDGSHTTHHDHHRRLIPADVADPQART